MYDQQPPIIDPIKLAAIMARENASMHECCLAAQCIRDLYDKNRELRRAIIEFRNADRQDHLAVRLSDGECAALNRLFALAGVE